MVRPSKKPHCFHMKIIVDDKWVEENINRNPPYFNNVENSNLKYKCLNIIDNINGDMTAVITVPDYWIPKVYKFVSLISKSKAKIIVERIYNDGVHVRVDYKVEEDYSKAYKFYIENIFWELEKEIDELILKRVKLVAKEHKKNDRL